MIMTKVMKQKLIADNRTHEKDSGSCEVQVSLMTERIRNLTEHLKTHQKDFCSRRGLLMLVGKRSALLQYLKRTDVTRYQNLITKLGIRK